MLAIENAMIWPGFGQQFYGSLIVNQDGKIEDVGEPEKIKSNPLYQSCNKIDVNKCTVIPAFTDCHCHLSSIVRHKSFIDLSSAKSANEVIETLSNVAKKLQPKSWIFGKNFNETNFPDWKIPTRFDLDVISNPIIIQRVCFHLHIINSAAFEIIGMSKFDGIEGAVRNENGELNGLLQEAASQLIIPFIDSIQLSSTDYQSVFNEFLSYGVAEIHTVGAPESGLSDSIYAYQKMRKSGELPVKIVVYLTQDIPFGSFFGDDYIMYGGRKIFMDGSLGANTAALRERYNCCDTLGILNHTDEELESILLKAKQQDLQIMAHCIGDRGIEQIVRMIEKVNPSVPVKLTHVQICPKDLCERIANLGSDKVIVDVQMLMLISDSPLLESWIGKDRIRDVFPLRSLIERNVVVTGSSDAPVETFNPMAAICAAVVRTPETGPHECIELSDALKMYTSNPQILVQRQNKKGTIEQGKVADLAIFECDIFNIAKDKLKDCKINTTIINGKIVYNRK